MIWKKTTEFLFSIHSILYFMRVSQDTNFSPLFESWLWFCSFSDSIIQESEAGNPCHDGTEEEAPTGAYTCNQNVSICLGR